jgi:hypothetical protein
MVTMVSFGQCSLLSRSDHSILLTSTHSYDLFLQVASRRPNLRPYVPNPKSTVVFVNWLEMGRFKPNCSLLLSYDVRSSRVMEDNRERHGDRESIQMTCRHSPKGRI